jgi:hypothetical protein
VRAAEVFLPVKFFESNEVALDKLGRVRTAAAAALSIEDLVRRVNATPLEVRAAISARKLPPLSADGRVVVKSAEDDSRFVLSAPLLAAVASLQRAGDVSEIVGSFGGYHFYYAIETWPEESLSNGAREQALEPLATADRLAPKMAQLRKTLRASVKVERSANTAALLERIGRSD